MNPDMEVQTETILAALRSATVNALAWKMEFDNIGMALKSGAIGPYEAIGWLDDIGAGGIVDHVTEPARRAA